ncbi:MAG: FKBP-type peptidyl-prolyl cis-trans isomerase [Chromatiales bacterium]|nr:MAG: FKBP-type peptidyl-prolyl cis-trans isomerase [Chromatiales bacterium]
MPVPARPTRSAVCVFGLAAAIALFASTLSVAKNHQDAAVEPPLPVKTKSGLVYEELVTGTGRSPAIDNVVLAHYHGTLADGTVFDSSVERGQPLELPLRQVIPCWQEGIPMMKEGGKARLTCPPGIAYGNRAVGSIPPGSTLTFEVELIQVVR